MSASEDLVEATKEQNQSGSILPLVGLVLGAGFAILVSYPFHPLSVPFGDQFN